MVRNVNGEMVGDWIRKAVMPTLIIIILSLIGTVFHLMSSSIDRIDQCKMDKAVVMQMINECKDDIKELKESNVAQWREIGKLKD